MRKATLKRLTKVQLQSAIDDLTREVAERDAHIHKLAHENERLSEDREELKSLRDTVEGSLLSLCKGFGGLPTETLVRQYQAEDELKRIRRELCQYAIDNPGTELAGFAMSIVSGHLTRPAHRVTSPEAPL